MHACTIVSIAINMTQPIHFFIMKSQFKWSKQIFTLTQLLVTLLQDGAWDLLIASWNVLLIASQKKMFNSGGHKKRANNENKKC